MPDRERIMQVVGEWTAKADNDLKTATHTLTLGVSLMPKNVRPKLSVPEQRRFTVYATGGRPCLTGMQGDRETLA